MGTNLVTRVRNFYIEQRSFGEDSHEVRDGCVEVGSHRVMRFDFLSYNAGNGDFHIGSPADRPDLFVLSAAHGHYHIPDFNEFLLFDSSGNLATQGYKQAFCAIDLEPIRADAGPAQFTSCNDDQGISAGWADVYHASLACQFVVIDNVPDGDYTLQSTTNATRVAYEDCYGDNTMWTGLRIAGTAVSEIAPPWIPEDRIPFDRNNLEVKQFAGRWKVVEGGSHWMIDTGTSRAEAERCLEIITHFGLAHMCFVGRPTCGDVEPMMYFLTDKRDAPSGDLADEDCLPFDPGALTVTQIGERWKVVEGTHWLLDFGPGEGNAKAALHFIQKYGFNRICFVGRPNPSMTYFKKVGSYDPITLIDPRVIDFRLELPVWLMDQRGPVFELGREITRVATVQATELPGRRPTRAPRSRAQPGGRRLRN